MTKIYFLGTISLSELGAFLIAPIVFILNYKKIRDDGFLPFIWMVAIVMVSMFISSWYNSTAFPYVVKSFAVLYSIFAHIVVFHKLLRDNYSAHGWYLLGVAISSVISIFYFNPTAMVSESGMSYIGEVEAEDIVAGPLFWVSKIVPWFTLPISAIYLKMPLLYSIMMPLIATAVMVSTSVSGRSASLSILLACALICLGRKSRHSMSAIGRHFVKLMILLVLVVVAGATAYKYTAAHGFLGEDARLKYEGQTRHSSSILSLLMSGRKEFFAAIPAVVDKPIVGHGPFARDTEGYWERFLSTYGDIEDLQGYYFMLKNNLGIPIIPTHSHIMGFWVFYGIGGLLFWIYVGILIYQHIKKFTSAVPQWYGFLAIQISNFIWALFFSPFGSRGTFTFMMCCILFSRAIGQGRLQLPYEMEMEARKYD
ncbi:MAG: hypothetical protein E7049_00830 [Lentisphaerae bacterium]|nr:hypothetical protein [Lentisphaerota bacterium]